MPYFNNQLFPRRHYAQSSRVLPASAINNTSKLRTADEVRDDFARRGKTITEWALKNGYKRNEVYRVLNGQCKAYYGRAHEIAVKLGLKSNPDQLAA